MAESISEADAQRDFEKILRAVREGHSYVVMSGGKPVARIEPPGDRPFAHVTQPGGKKRTPEEHEAAKAALLARLESQPGVEIEPWTRAELYEDE